MKQTLLLTFEHTPPAHPEEAVLGQTFGTSEMKVRQEIAAVADMDPLPSTISGAMIQGLERNLLSPESFVYLAVVGVLAILKRVKEGIEADVE